MSDTLPAFSWRKPPPAALACLVAGLYFALMPSFRAAALFRHRAVDAQTIFTFPPPHPPDDPYAWKVDPGTIVVGDAEHPEVELKAAAAGNSLVTLRADVVATPGARGEVVLRVPATGAERVLASTTHLRQGYFRLDPWLKADAPFSVAIIGRGGIANVERFAVFKAPRSQAPPRLDLMLLALYLIWLLVDAVPAGARRLSSIALAVGVPLILVTLGLKAESGLAASWALWWILCAVATAARVRRRPAGTRAAAPEWMVLIILLAVAVRWTGLIASTLEPMEGDPCSYADVMRALAWSDPFHTGSREPLYIWLQKIGTIVFGPNGFQWRLVSLLLSVTTVALTHRLALRLSGSRLVASVAALLMSLSPFAIYSSTAAERTQSFEPLLLIFALLLLRPGAWTAKRVAIASVVCALVWLNWLIALLQISLLLAFLVAVRKIPWSRALAIPVIAVVLLTPYWLVTKKYEGSALAQLNHHASYYKSADVEHVYAADQKMTTWWDYLRERGVATIAKKAVVGYTSMILNPFDRFNRIFLAGRYWDAWNLWIFPFYLAGIVVELRRRRGVSFLMFLALSNVAPYLSHEMISPRYIFFVAPLFAYWVGVGAEAAVLRFRP